MKRVIIPAQITTVEDRVAGNVSFSQLLLFLTALFIGLGIYLVLPPQAHLAWYKIVLTLFATSLCLTLAIRIRGKLLLQWGSMILTYCLSPQYYSAVIPDLYSRDIESYTTLPIGEIGESQKEIP